MTTNRVKNSIKNIYFSIFLQFSSIILNYLTRFIFVRTLSEVYLGASGLFSNILTILSLAELGISSAIIYAMYSPIAENNIKKIRAYLNFYKKCYRVIALIVLLIGLTIMPALPFLIDKSTVLPNMNLIYLLYLIDSVCSYLCIYKISILNAMQKNYVYNKYQIASKFVTSFSLIIILILFKNFILYLTVQVICKILTNIIVSKKVDKEFPEITKTNNEKLDKKEEKKIFKNVYALFCNQIGNVLINGTDNIIISKFVNLAAVGFYSNYYLITSSIGNVIGQVFNSIVAVVGNVGTENNKEKSFNLFNNILFANFILSMFCVTVMYSCINDFILISFGKKYILSTSVVLIIMINFYLLITKNSIGTFKYALGIFWEDKYCYFVRAIINIVLSLILVVKFGVFGVFLATTISDLLTTFWIQPKMLYKYGFNKNCFLYFKNFSKYTILTIITTSISLIIIKNIDLEPSLLKVTLEFLISSIVSISTILILFKNKPEFNYFMNIFLKKFQKQNK